MIFPRGTVITKVYDMRKIDHAAMLRKALFGRPYGPDIWHAQRHVASCPECRNRLEEIARWLEDRFPDPYLAERDPAPQYN